MNQLPGYIGIGGYEIVQYEIYEFYKGVGTKDPQKVVFCEEDVLDEVEKILLKGPDYSFQVFKVEKAIIDMED